MSVYEQAAEMIQDLSKDDVIYLIDFMKRFMMPNNEKAEAEKEAQKAENESFMQELESMRIKAKAYFPDDFEPKKIWEEAMDEKYGCFN